MTSTTDDGRLIPTPDDRSETAEFDVFGEDDPQGPRRRRRRRIVAFTVIVGGLGVAAGAWYVTQELTGSNSGSVGELPLLIAEAEPVKVKPKDPGGAEIPNRDKYVYKSLESQPTEQPVEQLLPAPEEPLPKPVDAGPPLGPIGSLSLDDMWSEAPKARALLASETAPLIEPLPGQQTPAPTAPDAEGPAATSAAEPLAEMLAEVMGEQEGEAGLAGETIDVPPIGPEAGGLWLQVAALRDESVVEAEWSRLVKRYPEPLGAAQHRVVRADLGDKGIWYRLQAGPFGDEATAEAACRSIAAVGGACRVVQP